MNDNILFINNYIDDIEYDFLANGGTKYTHICKKFYGADIEKISIYIWTLNIMDEFSEIIIRRCKEVDDIENISKEIYKLIKTDRKKIILYAYLKGHVFGYNHYGLIKEFKNTCKDIVNKNGIDSLLKSDLEKHQEIKAYVNYIKSDNLYSKDVNVLTKNITKFYLNPMKNKIISSVFKFDIEKLISTIDEIMINDAIEKYNEGILDGIMQKINKKASKNNKITL